MEPGQLNGNKESRLDKEIQEKVKIHFIEICKRDNIKYKSKKYYDAQAMYFCGAMTATGVPVLFWKLAIATGREIVNY